MKKHLREILNCFVNYIQSERMSSLQAIEEIDKFSTMCIGLESWFKVEIIKVMQENGDKIKKIKGKGADLIINNGLEVELKAATDFNPKYILEGFAYKSCDYCMFLYFTGKYNENEMKSKLREGAKTHEILIKPQGTNKEKRVISVKDIEIMNIKGGWFTGFIQKEQEDK